MCALNRDDEIEKNCGSAHRRKLPEGNRNASLPREKNCAGKGVKIVSYTLWQSLTLVEFFKVFKMKEIDEKLI